MNSSIMVTVSGTGQEFQKSRQRENFELSGLETKNRCSEKRHLPKGALNLKLKCPESEAERLSSEGSEDHQRHEPSSVF